MAESEFLPQHSSADPGEYDLPPLEEVIYAEAATEASTNHPEENHDSILEEGGICGVFDGLGSTSNPRAASQLAKEKAGNYLRNLEPQSALDADYLMRRTLIQLNEDVRLDAKGKTTAAVAFPWTMDGKAYLTVGRCGDSRVVRLREDELTELAPSTPDGATTSKEKILTELENLSKDADSVDALMPLLANGRLKYGIPADELARYYFAEGRNIMLSALGGEEAVSFVETVELKDEDIIALATDGIMDPLPFSRIKEILQDHRQRAANALITAASAGEFPDRAKEDDRTAIVVKVTLPSKPQ